MTLFHCLKSICIKNRLKKKLKKRKIKKRVDDLKKSGDEIIKIETGDIGRTVFYEYVGYKMPSTMLPYLANSDREKNTGLVTLIQKNLNYLTKDYYNTPNEDAMNEKLKAIKSVVEDIL